MTTRGSSRTRASWSPPASSSTRTGWWPAGSGWWWPPTSPSLSTTWLTMTSGTGSSCDEQFSLYLSLLAPFLTHLTVSSNKTVRVFVKACIALRYWELTKNISFLTNLIISDSVSQWRPPANPRHTGYYQATVPARELRPNVMTAFSDFLGLILSGECAFRFGDMNFI